MTRFETLEPDWLPVREALERILAGARPLPVTDVPLSECPGRVLARDLQARVTLPPWDNSAMDGYAVRGEDVEGATPDDPVELRVAGAVQAGDTGRPGVEPGQAVRIMTGAPLPSGADTVIRVEDTDAEESREGRVRIDSDRDVGRHVRPAGEDFTAGEAFLARGTRIGSGQVAALAAQGYARVPVHRRPVVAVMPNGDELASLDRFESVREGRAVPECNGPALAAAARRAGADPRLLPIARDERKSILERLDEAAGADVLVTVGGASMGEADLLKRVLAGRGFELDFWRIRIRPGSPFSLGTLPVDRERLPVFGLPGNPGSAFVTFQILVRPYLMALAGHQRLHHASVRARAGEALRSPARLTHFFRVRLEERGEGPPEARLTGPQGSGLVQSLGRADGLAVVREGVETVEEGEELTVIHLNEGPGWQREPAF